MFPHSDNVCVDKNCAVFSAKDASRHKRNVFAGIGSHEFLIRLTKVRPLSKFARGKGQNEQSHSSVCVEHPIDIFYVGRSSP